MKLNFLGIGLRQHFARSRGRVFLSTQLLGRRARRRNTRSLQQSAAAEMLEQRLLLSTLDPAGSVDIAASWQSQDVGRVRLPGSTTWSGDAVTVSGSGRGFSGSSDGFHFVYQTLNGDGEIIARVAEQSRENPSGLAGVMVRESLLASSPFAAMSLGARGRGGLISRSGANGSVSQIFASTIAPGWVRLIRVGETLTGQVSSDGVDWRDVGSVRVQMSEQILVGLAVTSAKDGRLQTARFENVSVTETPNRPPLAADEAYVVGMDSVLQAIAAASVLANDRDPDRDPLQAVLVSGPSSGSLTLRDDGSFEYRPNAGFVGQETFTYQADDGAARSTVATATITVKPAVVGWQHQNVGSISVTGTLDSTVSGFQVSGSGLGFQSKSDTLHLAYQAVSGDLEIIAQVVRQDRTNSKGFAGITLRESLNGGSSVAAILLTPQGAATMSSRSTTAGRLVKGASVSTNATWLRLVRFGDTVTGFLSADGVNWEPLGSATVKVSQDVLVGLAVAAGRIGAVHSAEFAQVTIAKPNHPPLAAADGFVTAEDEPLVMAAAAGVLANDGDADGDAFTAQLASSPAHGTLAFSADGSFTYTPQPNFHGADRFTYRAKDARDVSHIAAVTINVTPVNDAPNAVDDAVVAAQGQELTLAARTTVLANDSDVDQDTLNVVGFTQPTNGTLKYVTKNSRSTDGSFVYVSRPGFFGADRFTYTVRDGGGLTDTATVLMSVNAIPNAQNDSLVVAEDSPAAANVLANDTDADSLPLSILSFTPAAHGTVVRSGTGLTYTPFANYFGADHFSYVVSDTTGLVDSADVAIVVNPVADAPLAVNDTLPVTVGQFTPLAVLTNDVNVDGDALRIISFTKPANGAVTLNSGSLKYTSGSSFTGTDQFTYTVRNAAGLTSTATVTVVDAAQVTSPPDTPPGGGHADATGGVLFFALADVPYSSSELPKLREEMSRVGHNVEFVIHLGDIKSSGGRCVESEYTTVADALRASPQPVFIVPGDNEWNDCSNVDEAWQLWEASFSRFEDNWDHSFNVRRQIGRDENFSFVHKGVLFIGLNMVGGSIHDKHEWAGRMQDNADWVDENFARFGADVTSVVLFAQASADGKGREAFAERFVPAARRLGKPVVYMHGDEHVWKLDQPFSAAPNITRVVLKKGLPSIEVVATGDPDEPFHIEQ